MYSLIAALSDTSVPSDVSTYTYLEMTAVRDIDPSQFATQYFVTNCAGLFDSAVSSQRRVVVSDVLTTQSPACSTEA